MAARAAMTDLSLQSCRADSVSAGNPIKIDFSTIEELAGGDPAAISELVAMFIRHTAESIAKVRAALESGDFTAAALAAHTSIGFTSTLGITVLMPTLRELECACRAGAAPAAALWLARWERQFERAQGLLKGRTEKTTGPS